MIKTLDYHNVNILVNFIKSSSKTDNLILDRLDIHICVLTLDRLI